MADFQNWDSEFEKLVENMNESGEPNDDILALLERHNDLVFKKDIAQILYLRALSTVNVALTFAIASAIILGFAWSFYAWFS